MNKDYFGSYLSEISWKNIIRKLMSKDISVFPIRTEKNFHNIYNFSIFLMVIFVYVWGLGQLNHMAIKADDWEFMISQLPEGLKGFGSPWQKTLWEGRWINYLWSFVPSFFSVKLVYIIFLTVYSWYCWLLTSFFSQNKYLHFALAILFFLNPSYGALSLWPATMTPSLLIAVGGLVLLKSRFSNGIVFMGLIAVLLMAYSPVASMLLVFLLLRVKNRAEFLRVVGLYLAGFVLGVGIIYGFNFIFHGYFGIQPSNVRLHLQQYSLFQIQEKFIYFKDSYIISLKNYTAVLVASALAIGFVFWKNSKKAFLLVSIFVTLLGIDLAFQIYSGLDIPSYSRMWPWVWSIGVLYFFICEIYQIKYFKYLTSVFALVLAISGYKIWDEFYVSLQKNARYHEAIAQQVALSKTQSLQFCRYSRGMDLLNSRDTTELRLALWKKYKIDLRPVDKEICKSDSLAIGINYVNDEFILRIL